MTKLNKILLAVSIIGLIIIGFSVFKSKNKEVSPVIKTQAQNKFISQENDGGNVKIIITPKTLTVGEKPSFDVVFETHSVDLNFDVAQISSLVDDNGNIYSNPNWNGSGPGGHHRSGTLSFDSILTQTAYVELIIKNVAGVAERKFKWNL